MNKLELIVRAANVNRAKRTVEQNEVGDCERSGESYGNEMFDGEQRQRNLTKKCRTN